MEWTVRIGEKDYIAQSDNELLQWYQEGRVRPDTFVYHPVLARWIRIAEVEELRSLAGTPLSVSAPETRGGGASPKAIAIFVALGVGMILLVLLMSSISQKAADKKQAAEEAAQSAARDRIKKETIAAIHQSLGAVDPKEQPDDYVRSCTELAELDASSMTGEQKERCAVAQFALAKMSFDTGDLVATRRALDFAHEGGGVGEAEYKRFDAQLSRREKAARAKAEAEAKAQAAKEARELEKIGREARKVYGEALRERFLDQNMDIKVRVTGSNNDRITLNFILFNDVWAHRIQKDGLLNELRDLGFRKVTLTDGYDYTVYWDFK